VLLMREELKKLPLHNTGYHAISTLLIDFRCIKVAALKLKKKGLITRTVCLPMSEIKSISDQGVTFKETNDKSDALINLSNQKRYGELIGLPVNTEAKKFLGHVATFKINSESGDIITIWVKTPLHLRGLWKNTLLINRDQVVEITPTKLVVDNNISDQLLRSPMQDLANKQSIVAEGMPKLAND